ncbi:Zn(2)-C6 fungal-type transcription factor [Pseudohyphozyma bogoriensis]|nr:Zn(2)-C6 fungal-type transcription factor [Pseudohyphozyma bogoriensis]
MQASTRASTSSATAAPPPCHTSAGAPAISAAASLELGGAIALLDELWNMEEEASQTRNQKRNAKKGPSIDTTTLACEAGEDVEDEVDLLVQSEEEEDGEADDRPVSEKDNDLTAILKNPLASLAHDEERPPPDGGWSHSPHEDGLYQSRPEFDLSCDPVTLGILTLSDLERLVALYFNKLRPFLWHLDPRIHTTTFLRNNSPFLTSALAAASASFDPESAHFATEIAQHARALAVKAFADGLKSVEVVQAFVFLAHWSQPEASWAEDRSWAWQGEALRIATEIRMDLTLRLSSLRWYKTVTPLTEEDLASFEISRERSWSLLFAGEIAMCIQTGRMEAVLGLSLPGGLKAVSPPVPPTSPDYNFHANESCNRIFARALNLWSGLREEPDSPDLRQAFVSFWSPALDEWRSRWPHVNPFIDVFAENIGIILNLISLRLKGGPAQPILTECRAAAIRTLQKVTCWEDDKTNIAYSSNFVIINIAYGALSYYFERTATPELETSCLNVANKLEWIGQQRPNGLSIATVHAARVRSLVSALRAQHHPYATSDTTGIPVETFIPSTDYSFDDQWSLATGWPDSFSNAAIDFLDSTTYDPMLGFTWGDLTGTSTGF